MNFRLLAATWAIIIFSSFIANSQTSTVRGTIQDSQTREAIAEVEIIIQGTSFSAVSDNNGAFQILNVPYGTYQLKILTESYESADSNSFRIVVNSSQTDAGVLKTTLTATENNGNVEIPVVSLSENELDGSSTANVSSVLSASRDPFNSAVIYNFSFARFQQRGYRNEGITYLNGIEMEDLTSGRTNYSSYSGLNDVLRNREFTFGLNPSSYSYGGFLGSSSIDAKASKQRKQFALSYAISNANYDNRIMATYGSGLLKGGWSFSASISRRWAKEGYVPGTYYDGWSWYLSLEKRISTNQSLSLTQVGTNTEIGRAGPTLQETADLSGSNYYNPTWGYQNGEARNSAIGIQQQPMTILAHEWNINSRSSLKTSLGYQYGLVSSSGLDWYNATDPRPDFYRRLPSYIEDSTLAAQATELWQNDESYRQVNWDLMYQINTNSYDSVTNANGIEGNTVTGALSRYIVAERVIESQRISFNTVYNVNVNDHYDLTMGYAYQYQKSEYYLRVRDLLGGDFYVNLNQFAEQDYPGDSTALQNDLNNPNRILHVGDKYGYDYYGTVNKNTLWVQNQFNYDKVDFFVSVQGVAVNYFREGLYRNGIFDSTSYGNSKLLIFETLGFKGGVTYKLDGRNYFFTNGAYEHRAPTFENSFVSPRTRNDVIANLTEQKVLSLEGGFIHRAPKFRLSATAYFTEFNDGVSVQSYYNEDYRTFVNYAISNIDSRHLGVEIGGEVALGKGWSTSAGIAIGQYYYNSRQNGTVTQDNKDTVLASNETIYSQDFYVANGPQTAMTLGLTYRSPKFWSLNVNANYFDNIYMAINPARRTIGAVDQMTEDDPNRAAILNQTQLDGQFTMNFFGSYSWKVNRTFSKIKQNTFLVINAGITNIFNNQDLNSSAYEQLRFDFTDKDPNKFAPKFRYAYGTTYFISLSLRFN